MVPCLPWGFFRTSCLLSWPPCAHMWYTCIQTHSLQPSAVPTLRQEKTDSLEPSITSTVLHHLLMKLSQHSAVSYICFTQQTAFASPRSAGGKVRGQMESSDTTLCWEIIKIDAFWPEMSDLSVSPQLTRYFSTLHFSLALLRKFTNLNSTSQKTFTEHQFYVMHCTGGCRYKGDSETDFRFQVTVKRGRQAAGQIISMQCDIC